MNIVFLVYEYAHEKTPSYGGMGTYFKTMAYELSKRGHNVDVFLYNPYVINEIDEFYDGDVKVLNLSSFFKNHFFCRKILQLSKKIKSSFLHRNMFMLEHKYIARKFEEYLLNKKVDIIKTHDTQGFFSYLKTDIPKIIHCSGSTMMLVHEFNYSLDTLTYNAMKYLEQKSFDNANYIMAGSNFSAKVSKKTFKTAEIDVIYNGIDLKQFNNDIKVKEIPYSLFYFGSVRETKGLRIVAEVFNEIIKKEPRATLHVIGKGEEYWNYLCEEVLTEKAQESSKYYGQIIRDKIQYELKKGSVFIFPTHGENFGFTFVEAMALEKPIVVSDIEVSKEIIAHNKDGFIAKSEKEYVDIILSLFNNDEKRNIISKRAKEKVFSKFSLDKMVDETIEYYTDIIDKNNL
ncbi:glycosyltransferase family 4 protein [Tenacibaculum salmonis]|uniref:glycosyltransferase family 4 protein n=1 Tax=Tenacibaculum sp. P3-BQ1 TaxID=3232310 RepID=UPI0034DFD694